MTRPGNRLPVALLCRLSGVSRSGYYSWVRNGFRTASREAREEQDLRDFELIKKAYSYRGYDKGVWGIYMRLSRMGYTMNHKKIRRLMRKYGLACPIRQPNPYRRMAKALRTNAVADNILKRCFREHGPRKVFLTDITYIPFKKKFMYLSVIMDAFTKQVMSYTLSDSLEVDFVLDTVLNMINTHGDSINASALIHSDQGCHYTSIPFRRLVEDLGIRQSMSRRGNCWDNAPQESFFGHMKEELHIKSRQWKNTTYMTLLPA
ncbi:MAG: IS3 family transposase [Parasporobacterium sp.]|nr:IS3 family transposase [Parasporobacterium sp.]